jgi:hypothetical protein
MQRTFRVRPGKRVSSTGIVRRASSRARLAHNLLTDAPRAWYLRHPHLSTTFFGVGVKCRVRAGARPVISFWERLTFLSHFAFALAQWTHAMGMRSVGESMVRGYWG